MRRRRGRNSSLAETLIWSVFMVLFVRYVVPWQLSSMLAAIAHSTKQQTPATDATPAE
jgi:hypothetical protein